MSNAWNDAPIQSMGEDEFERAVFAVEAAGLIVASRSKKESIVFGLTGAWGSGKSSMLKMIEQAIGNSHPDWRIARFTPWATSDVGGMLDEFYTSLSSALPKKPGKQVRNALGKLAQVAAPTATAIPWVGDSAAALVTTAGTVLAQQEPWDKLFEKASAKLQKLDIPLLLIVDDIDRLQTEELLALLKVVRLLGRFPGVQYLLAYDEATLHQSLAKANLVSEHDGSAARFIEKIVQYPLAVPPLLDTELLKRLDTGIDKVFEEAGRPLLHSARLVGLRSVYLSQLPTPRAINRFLAQLRHHLPLLPADEVEDEDVVMLTFLRTVFPTLYTRLPRWRNELVSGHTDEFDHSSTDFRFKPFNPDQLLETVPTESRADARQLLTILFPKLAPKQLTGLRHPGRHISNDHYFGRYFAMGILTSDISDARVADAVSAAGTGKGDQLVELLSLPDPERVALVLDKAERCTERIVLSGDGDERRLAILKAVMPLIDRVAERASVLMDTRAQIAVWAASMLLQISNEAPASEVSEALSATPRLGNQVRVLRSVERVASPPPSWLPEVITSCCEQATRAVLAHMQERDNAPIDGGTGWMLGFLITHEQTKPLVGAIAAGIDKGEFTIGDVAARFVQVSRVFDVSDSEWRLSDFDQAAFERFVPRATDHWYSLEAVEVDQSDMSWANYRAYAAGRVKQLKSQQQD